MREIIIQIFFGIELISLQFVLYAMLYPTRHRKIVENREGIIVFGGLTALGAGVLSCIAGGHITFFKWKEPFLISEAVTCILFYIVCFSGLLMLFLMLFARVFQLGKKGKGNWFRICKENIRLREDFSRTSVFNESKMTGEWTVGDKTYVIVFMCPALEGDMLVNMTQKDEFTYICNKAVPLGKPSGSERLLSAICLGARYMFFISTWRANGALYEHNDMLFFQNVQTILLSAFMLGSAWIIVYGLKSKTDHFGTCVRFLFHFILAVSLGVMPFLDIGPFCVILAGFIFYTRCGETSIYTDSE